MYNAMKRTRFPIGSRPVPALDGSVTYEGIGFVCSTAQIGLERRGGPSLFASALRI